jgi:hypothetical protein
MQRGLPSPVASFSDSIHLTAAGYGVLAEAHYDAFYAAILAVPVPASSVWSRGVLASLIVAVAVVMLQHRPAVAR